MGKLIQVYEIKQLGDASDWGAGYEWQCPRCGDIVRYFEGDSPFIKCSCRDWRFTVYAEGKDLEDKEE